MCRKMLCNTPCLLLMAVLSAACGGRISSAPLPSPTVTPCVPSSVGPFPATLQPTDLLVQLDWESGWVLWEASVHLDSVRVPPFTLLADGRAFYGAVGEHPHPGAAQTMVAHLTPSEAQALVQHVLDLGFECLESYTDQEWKLADGTVERVVDSGTSALRVRLPNGELREIRNYHDFANDREALRAIRTFLDDYQHPQAEPYTPEKATLLVKRISEPPDVAVLDWPLDPGWLVPPEPATAPWAAVLTGSDVESLLAATGLNMGDFWFRDADRFFAVHLAPQIPGVDHGALVTVSGERLVLVVSPGATAPPTPVPACLQASSPSHPSRLIVEEHALKIGPIPAEAIPAVGPGFSTYFETADGGTSQILEAHQAARDAHAFMLASNNALLEPFGYRLELKTCGEAGGEWYTLYQGTQPHPDPVQGLYPASVSASGTNLAMLLTFADGRLLLTKDGLAPQASAGNPPVYLGDELLTVQVSDQIDVYLGEQLLYHDDVMPGPFGAVAPDGPWSYDGHWVLEQVENILSPDLSQTTGHIIQDGRDLNQTCGYEESFTFALLDGRPFYFVKHDGRIDIAYDGQQVPAGYDHVPHYLCCSGAALNPRTSPYMVWFFAMRGEQWYYVEAYVPLAERLAPTLCPTPTPVVVPTLQPLPTPAILPGMPQPGAAWARPMMNKDGMVMRYVPGGPFYTGSPESLGEENEHPLHIVTLDPFWIDETEVTQTHYQACVEAGACDVPRMEGYDPLSDKPVEVTWDVAQSYCRWAGGRLPTEAEWEKAARGTDARTYPWGNERPDCSRANHESLQGFCSDGPDPVGSYPAGISPYGVLDLAGNEAEWVNDRYDPDYYARSPEQNPQGPDSGQARVARGGSWYMPFPYIRTAYRDAYAPRDQAIGFRCVVPAAAYTVVPSDRFGGWDRYTNLDYGFSFHYPPDWTLEDRPRQIILQHKADNTLRLTVEYRRGSEDLWILRTGMPAGDFIPRGSVPCLGREISRDVLVYEGKDKMVLYNYSSAIPWGDMVFDPVLEVWGEQVDYGAVDLPKDVQRQIDQVVSSFELHKD